VKRNAADVLRRGFEVTAASWPLLLIRIVEHIVMALMAIAAILAIIVPIAVSAGLGHFNFDNVDADSATGIANTIASALLEHWMLLVFILLVVTIVLFVFVAIHSFVQAGCAGVYVDGQFTMDRFLAGGRRGWWPVFWIYNIAWLYAGVVLLVPILPIPFIIILTHASTGAMVAGCLLLVLWAFFAIFVCLAAALWTMKAIVIAIARHLPAREALAEARREIRADPGSHLVVGFIMLVIWIGGASVIGMFSGVMSVGHATPLAIITAPTHVFLSLLNAIFSAGVESWFLATFVSMES
jgi:hypothetical protein